MHSLSYATDTLTSLPALAEGHSEGILRDMVGAAYAYLEVARFLLSCDAFLIHINDKDHTSPPQPGYDRVARLRGQGEEIFIVFTP